MKAEIYWVNRPGPGRLAIMPRPRGGDWLRDDLQSLREEGVEILVSLLEPHENEELDLAGEPQGAREAGLEFRSHPIPDHSTPESLQATASLVRSLERRLRSGASIAVHCRAGIGRSATVAAAVLLAHGLSLDEALGLLEEARGFRVPETREQVRWLEDFAGRIGRSRKPPEGAGPRGETV